MMWKLLALETRLLLRERLALVVVVVSALACLFAGLNGAATLRTQIDARSAAQETAAAADERIRQRIAGATEPADTVFLPIRLQRAVIAPMPPLPDFSAGRAPYEPLAATIQFRTRSDTLFRSEQLENPDISSRGAFDLETFVVVVAPLLLIALGFSIFARDRDTGSARLVLMQAGTPLVLLLARSIPRITLVVAPIAIAAAVLLVTGPAISGRTEAALIWLGIAAASLLVWWSVILLVNSLRVPSETAALVLVATWVAVVVVAPSVVSASAQIAAPPPSRFNEIAVVRATEISATRQYENDHPDLNAEDLQGWLADMRKGAVVNATVEEALSPVSRAFEDRRAQQRDFVRRFEWLSPSLATSGALQAVAGVDGDRYTSFRAASLRFLQDFKRVLRPFVARDAPMTQADVDAVPRFSWTPAQPSAGPAIAYLCGLWLALLAIAFVRFRKVSPD